MNKDLVFYAVASVVIGLIAQFAGASLTLNLFLSLLIPPVILLTLRIVRR